MWAQHWILSPSRWSTFKWNIIFLANTSLKLDVNFQDIAHQSFEDSWSCYIIIISGCPALDRVEDTLDITDGFSLHQISDIKHLLDNERGGWNGQWMPWKEMRLHSKQLELGMAPLVLVCCQLLSLDRIYSYIYVSSVARKRQKQIKCVYWLIQD